MDSPDCNRSYVKRDINEDSSDLKSDRAGDNEEWEASDKRKHRSSKARKSSNGEDAEIIDASGRRRSFGGDRNESRKRLSGGGSSKAGSDDDDYETRKELRLKQMKKKQEESSLEKLSSWYQDGELENRLVGEKPGSKGYSRPDESEREKMASKISEHESSCSGSKSKEERSRDGEHEKTQDRDCRYSDRRESSREKAHGSIEPARTSRRRWDEPDAGKKTEEIHHEKADLISGKGSNSKYENSKERSISAKNESKGLDSNNEKGAKANYREEKRADGERNKSKSRSKAVGEDDKGSPITHEGRSGWDKSEKHRQQRSATGRDAVESRERSSNADEDGTNWVRDKNARELGQSNRSRTPERRTRHHQESQYSEIEYEISSDIRRKDLEKDGHRDDRSKGSDDSWSERNRDRESSKDSWKRRQSGGSDTESKDGDLVYDRGRDWEPRQGRDRNDNERPHGRTRGEAVKTSSNFGISNENYDVIEIQTKPLDYGRGVSGSNFPRRTEIGQQSDAKSAPDAEEWANTRDERTRRHDSYGSTAIDDTKERYTEDGSRRDPSSWRDEMDYQAGKGRGQRGSMSSWGAGGQSSGGSQPPYGNQEPGSFSRGPQGVKGSR